MRKAELISHMEAAMAEVLETMFFTSVIESRQAAGLSSGADALFSSLRFSGPPSGVFEVGMARDTACSLASGFLGDEELCDTRTREVVCELANMLCGSILSRIGGGAAFELSHPSVADTAMETPTAGVEYELPEGLVSAAVRLEDLL